MAESHYEVNNKCMKVHFINGIDDNAMTSEVIK